MINENEFNNYYTNSNVQNNHINKQKQMHFDIFFEDHISNLSQLSDEDNQGTGTISLQQIRILKLPLLTTKKKRITLPRI
jgi:hypothetical protein